MPLEVLQQTTHNSATSRFQFDFSYPSTIQERSRRSPEFWRSQPSPRTCGSSRTLKPLSQLPPVCTNNISRDLKETDDVRINMSGSYGGYGAGQHNTSYTLPAGDHRTHNGPSSVPYNGQSQYRSISQPISRAVSRPASPVFPPIETASKSRNSIVSYLQIPSTISSSRGSLAEFAAQITCLFWFEEATTLSQIEDSRSSPTTATRLMSDSIPSTGFLKWVTTILSTTQVTQNVILLALLFVYRLKKQNPTVKGRPGSEFRLLTVALMLGNKFLDDNTYTNKTWAEVSGISVQEIHVMEVEFLSHMKYNLFTSAEEWQAWHTQLSNFWKYFDRASRRLQDVRNQRGSVAQIPQTLPSPPLSHGASPPYAMSGLPPATGMHLTPLVLHPYLTSATVSPAIYKSESESRNTPRKRSWDGNGHEHPAKRNHTYNPYGNGTSASNMYVPSLEPNGVLNGHALQVPSLPPPQYSSSQRNTPSAYSLATEWPSSSFMVGTPLNQASRQSSVHDEGPARQSSLYSSNAHHLSPIGPAFVAATSHTPAQSQLSPSHFLTQRSSPYRPVRDISTLLVPPPSGALAHPSHHIPQEQMHWQTLGKNPHERKSGRVPYLHRDAWPESHQIEQWPTLYPINMQG